MSAASWPPCFARFFTALAARGAIIAGAPGSKGEWKAHCPAHDDTVQSLSVARGNKGQLIVRCHSPRQCAVPEIVKALGVRMADLYADQAEKDARQADRKKLSRWRPRKTAPPTTAPEPRREVTPGAPQPPPARTTVSSQAPAQQQQRTLVCTYPYKNAEGHVLYETCRWNPKGFNQRRPNPNFDRSAPPSRENPQYIWSLDGAQLVPYRLPELLAALKAKPDRLVLIVEGEKDVEQATAAGLVATTSPMGVGGSQKCWPLFAPYFKGANVVVIPDEDAITETGSSPGLAHAERIASSLMGVAASVRLARLPGVPVKGDLTDWWHLQEQAGNSIEGIKVALRNIINATPAYVPGQTATAAAHTSPSPQSTTPTTKPASPPPPPPVNATAAPTAQAAPVNAAPATKPAQAASAPANPPVTAEQAAKMAPVHAGAIESNPSVKLLYERGLWCAGQLRGAGVQVRSYAEFIGLIRLAAGRVESALERAGFRAMNDSETSKAVGQEVQVLAGILFLAAADVPPPTATATAPAK